MNWDWNELKFNQYGASNYSDLINQMFEQKSKSSKIFGKIKIADLCKDIEYTPYKEITEDNNIVTIKES